MLYEVTVTLRPCLYKFTATEQFDKTQDKIRLILCMHNSTCVAELTKEHNIHYHGIVDLKDISDKDYLCNRFRKYNKEFGRKSIEQVKYEDSYRKYIVKELSATQKIIGKYPVITNQLGLLGNPIDKQINLNNYKDCLVMQDTKTIGTSGAGSLRNHKPRKKNNYIK